MTSVHYRHSDIVVAINWLLNEDTEAVDVMASGREFHSVIVHGANDFWYSVDLQRGTWNFCCVTVPLTGLSFNTRFSLSGSTATCSLTILYRKASLLTRLRFSQGSSFNSCNGGCDHCQYSLPSIDTGWPG